MKSLKRYLPIFIIVLISLAAWGMGVHHYLSFDTLRVHHADLETYINIYPLTSFAVYMGVYIALVGLSIPGAAFMTLTGGFLFGQLVGTGLVVMSATIGATILFVSAKMASEDLVSQKAGPWVDKMKAGFQKDAFYYLLTLRLIPIFPFVVINLVAAVFQIPLRTFVIGTFIGIIPGSFVYVSIGNALKDVILTTDLTPKIILEPKVVVALIGLGILSLLPILYRRFSNR
jgi:uncharacterized membrane protein YdjX (TVP38/TMEM64 family)